MKLIKWFNTHVYKTIFLFFMLMLSVAYAANQSIPDRTELDAAPASNDELAIYDTSASAGRSITATNFLSDILTSLGISFGDTDLGTYTGSTIDDNDDLVGALQALETETETRLPDVLSDTTPELGGNLDLKTKYTHADYVAFSSTDTTPDVSGGSRFKTANAAATTIDDFDAGAGSLDEGQHVHILINDSNTTIDFTSSGLKGHGGVDWEPSAGYTMDCHYDGTDWACNVSHPTSFSSVQFGGFTANQNVRAGENGYLLSDNPAFITDAHHNTSPTSNGYIDMNAVAADYVLGTNSLTPETCAYGETYFVRDQGATAHDILIPDCVTAASDGNVRRLTICQYDDDEEISIGINPTATFTGSVDFAAADDTITRGSGSFVTDGFVVGQTIIISDAVDAGNNTPNKFTLSAVAALVLTCNEAITDESGDTVTIDAYHSTFYLHQPWTDADVGVTEWDTPGNDLNVGIGDEIDSPANANVWRQCITLICDYDGYWMEYNRIGDFWQDGGAPD